MGYGLVSLDGIVPSEWKGQKVVVRVRLTSVGREGFTAEGLIYQNDAVVRAINVNRSDIAVADSARGDERFLFYIEAAANSGYNERGITNGLCLPDYTGAPQFRLEQAELACVNEAAFAYYYDFKVAWEAMEGPARHLSAAG